MAINPTGNNNSWNYAHPDKEGYTDTLIGTVYALQEVQAREFVYGSNQPGKPRFWPDGKPVWNIRMALAKPDGQLITFTFPEAGKKQKSGEKPSVHMDLFNLFNDMNALIGKTLQIQTWPANPNTGQSWGQGNPRLFNITVLDSGPYQLAQPLPAEYTVPQVLADSAVSGGQIQQQGIAPQNIQVPQQMVQPQVQPQIPVQPMQPQSQTFQPQVTMQPQATQQPETTLNPMQPAIPAGMDPQVAAAMQNMGATNVQQVNPVYDDSGIPF